MEANKKAPPNLPEGEEQKKHRSEEESIINPAPKASPFGGGLEGA